MAISGPRRALSFLIVLACLLMQGGAWSAERNKAGAFDYYVLVLSWMPSYCRSEGRARKDGQCESSKPRAFRLHGLWPQYEKG